MIATSFVVPSAAGEPFTAASLDVAWAEALRRFEVYRTDSNRAKRSRLDLGMVLVELRRHTPRGQWRAELDQHGIHHKTAVRALNDAADWLQLNQEQRTELGLRGSQEDSDDERRDTCVPQTTECSESVQEDDEPALMDRQGNAVPMWLARQVDAEDRALGRPLKFPELPPVDAAPAIGSRPDQAVPVIEQPRGVAESLGSPVPPGAMKLEGRDQQLDLASLYEVAERAKRGMDRCLARARELVAVDHGTKFLDGLFAALTVFAESLERLHAESRAQAA